MSISRSLNDFSEQAIEFVQGELDQQLFELNNAVKNEANLAAGRVIGVATGKRGDISGEFGIMKHAQGLVEGLFGVSTEKVAIQSSRETLYRAEDLIKKKTRQFEDLVTMGRRRAQDVFTDTTIGVTSLWRQLGAGLATLSFIFYTANDIIFVSASELQFHAQQLEDRGLQLQDGSAKPTEERKQIEDSAAVMYESDYDE